MLNVEPGEYLATFEAAAEAARSHGMRPVLRDPRGGVIETDATVAGSILEPWRDPGDAARTTIENTLHAQRRRVRFEFTQTDVDDVAASGGRGVAGDLSAIDLTRHDGSLELRARVFIERAYEPGRQHSIWTSRVSSTMRVPEPGDPTIDHAAPFWVTVARDPDMERRLLARVAELVSQ